ncbi:type II toxin-antitoxin system RelE/ParE family toxin [Chamaesiphon polymorphus]|uniref:Cytotoxic translational repressor of toxin-antitoxin stability system n=1 Tax=Chamaesiphon polymorphus CCALA 037 TaxID=2107692 RepID=A0A2T1GFP3_9CYAN|nr:type II toxin-antitoxin system RelE/ParE family toxin [Chamaesiphon polymorphus]PSB56367.1 cytotoxic translational repressor of toxin-antitoxin stability system [Chamaesiphon polymorphus CCALA 037]
MQDRIPPIKIYESTSYKKELRKLNKRYRSIERDIKPLIEQLEAGETPGDRIVGNEYPVYKVRVPNSDTRKGKSSGYRVIYYMITLEAVLLTTIYAKSDRGNISNKEVEDIIGEYELEIDDLRENLSERETETIGTDSENIDTLS